jgi:hypothetical protein
MKYWHPLFEYPFLKFIHDNDVILLSLTLLGFFILLYHRLYVPLLFVSLLLLFFNLFFIPRSRGLSEHGDIFLRRVRQPAGRWLSMPSTFRIHRTSAPLARGGKTSLGRGKEVVPQHL